MGFEGVVMPTSTNVYKDLDTRLNNFIKDLAGKGHRYRYNRNNQIFIPYPRTPWDKINKVPKGNVFDFYHIQKITGIYKDSLEKGCKGIDKALIRLINYEKDDRAPTGWDERTCLGLEVYRFNTKREKYGKC